MEQFKFKVEDNGQNLRWLWLTYGNKSYCRLFWMRNNGMADISMKRIGTYEEIVQILKNELIEEALAEPRKIAEYNLQLQIDAKIKAMSHQLTLRVAEFRGYLFNQVQQLRG